MISKFAIKFLSIKIAEGIEIYKYNKLDIKQKKVQDIGPGINSRQNSGSCNSRYCGHL